MLGEIGRRGIHICLVLDIQPAGHLHHVDIFLRRLHKGQHILKTDASRHIFIGGDPHLDREIRSHRFPHLAQNPQREFHPVFDGAAVFIGALIKQRRQKLRYQPPVSEMKKDHIKTHVSCVFCCLHISCRHLVHHGLIHRFYFHAVFPHITGRADGKITGGYSGVLPCMGNLHGSFRPAAMGKQHSPSCLFHLILAEGIGFLRRRPGRLSRLRDHGTGNHHPGPPQRSLLKDLPHGVCNNAVAHHDRVYFQRGK